MAVLDSVQAAYENTAALLAEITKNPKPTYSVHGHTFKWTEYQQFLVQSLNDLARTLAQLQPFEEIGLAR